MTKGVGTEGVGTGATRKPINLALQGGGAHGAYAWGIVDRLLESERVELNAITATSAGAMNAVALACGYAKGGDAGARAQLEAFWRGVSEAGSAFAPPDLPWLHAVPFYDQMAQMAKRATIEAVQGTFSPYQSNPFGLNPLEDVLERVVDFDTLRADNRIKLFISATNVRTGKVKVFENEEITARHVLASACLPHVFQAVELGGEAYWDGGYMGNPSLWPLFYETDVSDLLVVHINPMERREVPKTVAEIDNRINEVSFNASLMKEMRAVAFVQKLLREGWVREEKMAALSDIRFHAIRADKALSGYSLASKFQTDWAFLCELRDRGREAAEGWLNRCWEHVGTKDSVDLRAEFLGL